MTAHPSAGDPPKTADVHSSDRQDSFGSRPLLIAIDGPAGSGKSTLAKALASRFGLGYIETGAMYRAVALKALLTGIPVNDEDRVTNMLRTTQIDLDGDKVSLDGEDVSIEVRTKEVSSGASRVATMPGVRSWCVDQQRKLANLHSEGAVVEGRDIGTVVLPEAQLKIFLTADLDARASRRALETGADETEILQKLQSRDRRDTERSLSPLIPASDAVLVDTTKHSAKQIVDQVAALVQSIPERSESGRG